MLEMQNVLITCAGGAGSLPLAESLPKTFRVFLADANDHITARTKLPFRKIPMGSNPSYSEALHSLIKEWNIDYIVPGADEELVPLARLQEEGIVRSISPDRGFIETCLNKKQLMRELDAHGISTLLPFEKKEDVSYPAIAKPVFGRGSREVHRIDSNSELQGYLQLYGKTFSEILVQPYIAGEEFTVSVIVNNRNQLIGIVPKRVIEKRGITQIAVTEKNDLIEEVCKRIVEKMHPCGPFNVQLKFLENACFIFEINPRLSTTAILTDRAFGNEIELYIRYFDSSNLASLPTMKEGVYLRRHHEHRFVTSSKHLPSPTHKGPVVASPHSFVRNPDG